MLLYIVRHLVNQYDSDLSKTNNNPKCSKKEELISKFLTIQILKYIFCCTHIFAFIKNNAKFPQKKIVFNRH